MAHRRNKLMHDDQPTRARVATWQWWAIGGVVVYLVLFFSWPLADLPHGADQPPLTRWQLTIEALVADVVLFDWLGQASWQGVLQRGWILLFVAAYWLVAACVGMVLVCLADRSRHGPRAVDQSQKTSTLAVRCSPLERLIFAIGAGLAIFSLITLIVGLLGRLTWPWLAGSIALLAMCGAKETWVSLRAMWQQGGREGTNKHRLEVYLLGLLAVLVLLAGMLPPLDFDVREYHLQAPKEFFQAGQISFLPHNVYANMPLGAEMHVLASMVVVGDWWWGALFGKAVMASFAILTALALVAGGARFFSLQAGWFAALIYLATPWSMMVSTSGLNEGVLGCYTLLAVLAIMHYLESIDLGMVALAGLFVGAAVACKYTAVVFVAIPLVLCLLVAQFVLRRQSWRSCAIAMMLFATSAIATGGLWFAKNATQTGNPTYPLLASVFGGETRTAERDQQWRAAHKVPNYYPSDMLDRVKRTTIASEWLSPVLVPCLAIWLLRRDRPQATPVEWLLPAMLVFVWLAWWLLTHRLDRFLTPLLPIGALLAGAGVALLPLLFARSIVTLAVVYGALLTTAGLIGDNRLFADLRQLADDPLYVSSQHQYLNENAEEVTGVLLVGDAQPFMLRPPVRYNTCFDENVLESICRDRTPLDIAAELHRQKISHLLVDWSEIDRYRSPGNYGFTEFIQPEMFNRLQREGVITLIDEASDERRRLYRVVPVERGYPGNDSPPLH